MSTGRRCSMSKRASGTCTTPKSLRRCGWCSSLRLGPAVPSSLVLGWVRSLKMVPGSIKGLHLVVDDMGATRQALMGRGIELSDVDDMGGVLYSYFSDPDGNMWALQQWPSGYQPSFVAAVVVLSGAVQPLRRHHPGRFAPSLLQGIAYCWCRSRRRPTSNRSTP